MIYFSANRIVKYFSCLLLFLMLAFPYILQPVKILLIMLIVFSIFIKWKKLNLVTANLRNKYSNWILLFVAMNALYLAYGMIRSNPGVHFYITIYFIWFLLFYILYSQITDSLLISLIRTLDFSFLFISITGLLVFCQSNNYCPTFINEKILGYEIGDRPMFEFRSIQGGAIVSFITLFPYILSKYILANSKFSIYKMLNLVLGILFIFATSRRAIILSLLYLPFLIFFLFKRSSIYRDRQKVVTKRLILIFSVPVILFTVFSIYLGLFDHDIFIDFIFSGFDSNGGTGYDERHDQLVALLNGWLNNFFLGAGTGVNAAVVRNEIPGAYELSYFAILFERGLIGSIIYFAQLFYLIKWNIQLSSKCRNEKAVIILVSFNVAFISFLIANASNPYLNSFDHLWVIFMNIIIQNSFFKYYTSDERYDLCTNKSI